MASLVSPDLVQHAAEQTRERCTELNIPVFILDSGGRIITPPPSNGLYELWLTGPMLAEALETASSHVTPDSGIRTVQAAPGFDLLIMPLASNRGLLGSLVVCFLGATLLRSEFFERSCEAATLNCAATRSVVAERAVWSPDSIPAAARLAEWCYFDALRTQQSDESCANATGRLSSSYETISALFAIGRGMSGIAEPARFVNDVVTELADATDFGWIALRLDAGAVPSTPDEDFWALENTSGFQPEWCRDAMGILGPDVEHGATATIIDEPDGVHERLGPQVVRQTIECDGHVAGVILAGNKSGDDPQVSSYETLLIEAAAAFLGAFLENAQLYAEQEQTFLGTIQAMSNAIDAKDPYTRGHSERVACLGRRLALAVGLTPEQAERIYVSGLIHDVGKIGVPEAVLTKPDRLTDDEFELIKQHPAIGERILKGIPMLKDTLPGVRSHHERWDGRGYPDGLAGENIPLMARILGIADTFDAMSSNRAYRAGMDRAKVLAEIERCAGAQFDPALVPHLLSLEFSEYDRQNAVAVAQKPGTSQAA